LGDTIRDLDPDIIALQEVPLDIEGDLGRILGRGYHLSPFSGADGGVGGTVATRWPHRFLAEVDLHVSARARDTLSWCAAVLVEIDTPVGTVVVAHHKPS
jgi:hypothetical protein